MFLLVLTLGTTALMPFAVFGVVNDTVDAALIAGVFSIVNTYLNLKMLRRTSEVQKQLHATKKSAREGSDALLRLADRRDRTREENDKRN